jgi:hypothetical protein
VLLTSIMVRFFGRMNNTTSARCLAVIAVVAVLQFFAIDRQNKHASRSLLGENVYARNSGMRPGVIVLGMHRSGTSMLSGILVEGFGYETGGPLLMPNSENEKVR